MKINLITLQRARNYGSVLQTLALQLKLEELGHQVGVLDFYPERYTDKGLLKRLKHKSPRFRNPLFLLAARILIYPSFLKKSFIFGKFLKRLHVVGKTFSTAEEAKVCIPETEAYCTGSDQVWNSHWNEGVDKTLFLDFAPKGKLLFSYAASFGLSQLPEGEKDLTKLLLERYQYISVREDSGVDILKELGRDDGVQVLDPTLLLTKEEWEPYVNNRYERQNYVLTYNLHHDSEINRFAKALGEKHHIPVYNISYNWHDVVHAGHLKWCPAVEGFLGLIKHARYVIADSFHATVFSIIFEKQFVSIAPEVASSRLSSILKLMGISERLISHYTDTSLMETPIDYRQVKALLAKEQQKSMDYLRMATTPVTLTHNI